MRIEIDMNRCEGHGTCEVKAPDVLSLDADGYPVPLVDGEVPERFVAQAHEAVSGCPVAALRAT